MTTTPATAAVSDMPRETPPRTLLRTGHALVTVRNPDGRHLVFRFKRRAAWTDRRGVERPGEGYWLDCREAGHEWTRVGIASENGELRRTANSTKDAVIVYGAEILLHGLAAREMIVERSGRGYTLHVEDRCGRCGRQLTDPISIERGLGPECYGAATGSKAAR